MYFRVIHFFHVNRNHSSVTKIFWNHAFVMTNIVCSKREATFCDLGNFPLLACGSCVLIGDSYWKKHTQKKFHFYPLVYNVLFLHWKLLNASKIIIIIMNIKPIDWVIMKTCQFFEHYVFILLCLFNKYIFFFLLYPEISMKLDTIEKIRFWKNETRYDKKRVNVEIVFQTKKYQEISHRLFLDGKRSFSPNFKK